MSDALIASLQSEINRLNGVNAKLSGEAKDRRIKSRTLQEQLDAAEAKFKVAADERDGFKATATAAPGEKDLTIAALSGKLLARDHRDAFASVASFDGPAGADGKTPKYTLNTGVRIEDVWQFAGYKAEGVTPTAEVVTAAYGKAQAAHPFLFAETTPPAADAATNPSSVARREAGPGARTSNPLTTVTPSIATQVDVAYGNRPLGRIA